LAAQIRKGDEMGPASGIAQELVERLSRASHLVVLTGAGVSSESGVPTFRGEDGLWNEYRAEDLATNEAFDRDPELVWRWYDYRRQIIADTQPNAAHDAIARLEQQCESFDLITQNVDGLHERAGSLRPTELHGNIWRARCVKEQKVIDLLENPLGSIPPICADCGALMRPDVVWFGEPLPMDAYEASHLAASSCDAMLVVGTSAVVRPAASLPLVAKHNGAFVVEVNVSFTPISALIDTTLIGRAGELMPALVDEILKHRGASRQTEEAIDGGAGASSRR
jgi:NAD-dependent deacetylase